MKTYEIAVAAVYCPPRHNIKEENFFEFFRTLENKFIAGGDYNCKNSLWGSRLTTTTGRELSKLIHDITQDATEFTCMANEKASIV
jgi:hypothetical protein